MNIEKGATFGSGSNIEIGSNSGLGKNCMVNGPVRIGKYVMIGPDVMLIARRHRVENTDLPMALQGDEICSIEIEDDVWIGARVVILAGVKVGKGAIVGAGSIVTKNVPEFSIVGGNPAKLIKWRKTTGATTVSAQ